MRPLSQGRWRRHDTVPHRVLDEGWQLCAVAAGMLLEPDQLIKVEWLDVGTLGPAAHALRQAGAWSLDAPSRRFDADDWWYRLRFDAPELSSGQLLELGLDGLATLAEVWLNGKHILSSDNMFVAHRLDVTSMLKPAGNELVLVCRSLDAALAQRRPRPRWKAPMVENQQLRWFRTTLLGRVPGWCPPVQTVGPWRAVWLSAKPRVQLTSATLRPQVLGRIGRLEASCEFELTDGVELLGAELVLMRAGQAWRAPLVPMVSNGTWQAILDVQDVQCWWPHTHGEPALYEAHIAVTVKGEVAPIELDIGHAGFRHVELDQSNGRFALKLNGQPVFCRGACWTPIDIVTLDADSEASYLDALMQAQATGMNMVRVGGTMAYEADAFYDACDRLGIMVWQDFMFANLDYPEDATFTEGVTKEVSQQLQRWQGRPSLVVLCGNSEVEQQAAMFGATRDRWAPALFHETLAELVSRACPDVPYWPSSAHGGSFPHQGDAGTTSYYGVGAYMRGLDDARRAGVSFATECLAFANVPEPSELAKMPGGLALRVHHPAWKARGPRDLGAGWDFDDVRDHYVGELFEVDPSKLRYSDHERYLVLGRVAVGEVMAATFAEWRRSASSCGGGLIWFWRDLWPGAGWGVVDSSGHAKAVYHYLKRAWQALSVTLTDEGGNGYHVHAVNDSACAVDVEFEVTAWRHGAGQAGSARAARSLPPHSAQTWVMQDWFEWFADWSWSYRFGPAGAQVVSVVMREVDGPVLSQAVAFPAGMALPQEHDLGLSAEVHARAAGVWEVTFSTTRFAQAVHIDVSGVLADDNYFHLLPGQRHTVCLRATPGSRASMAGASGVVRAINLDGGVNLVLPLLSSETQA